ncbi:MAG: Gmad2 immunoglobulin-like domain-containing protein [bacterium]|nr:Gmad2 immunoglobulin-like domain-containing protein [bacterium]
MLTTALGAWWYFGASLPAVQDLGNAVQKEDLIRLDMPQPNQTVKSPLTLSGQARGSWFFEASFPVVLQDQAGNTVANGVATAQGDWMTSEFVPFTATLTFVVAKNLSGAKGLLLLKKDNPSGLPEHDDALQVPVVFDTIVVTTPPPVACTMEVKLCPDGSAVGRMGPNCEFAECPQGGGGGRILPYNSGIQGTVMLGPTCPVMRDPPDPACADKPYQTTVSVYRVGDTVHAFATATTGADGTFKISLPPGEYIVDAAGGAVMPRCTQTSATVAQIDYTQVAISCDSGIR